LLIQATSEQARRRLDHFLQQHLPEISRSRLQEWIKAGRVLVDGVPQKPSYLLRGAELVDVSPAAAAPLKAFAEDIPIEILYSDADVIAVNKQAGMVVHAGAGRRSGTLVNALLHRFGELSAEGGGERPGIVHRIDRETSGVLLVARTDSAHRHLATQFSSRSIEKNYLALVHGTLKHDRGQIDAPVARDPLRRTRMTARLAYGRAAHTEYTVLERMPKFTYIGVRIGTGRTHQIRVHMARIGHVVAGDKLYGAPAAGYGRFFLHAHSIAFRSPSDEHVITVEAPLPDELNQWLAEVRMHGVTDTLEFRKLPV
jgi:23S rRNA pseudouridine1911/1915/1917 synthase